MGCCYRTFPLRGLVGCRMSAAHLKYYIHNENKMRIIDGTVLFGSCGKGFDKSFEAVVVGKDCW